MIVRNSRSGSVSANASLLQVKISLPSHYYATISGTTNAGAATASSTGTGSNVSNTLSFPFDSNYNTQSFASLHVLTFKNSFILQDALTGSLTGGFTQSGLSGNIVTPANGILSRASGSFIGVASGSFTGAFAYYVSGFDNFVDVTQQRLWANNDFGTGTLAPFQFSMSVAGIHVTMSGYYNSTSSLFGPGIDTFLGLYPALVGKWSDYLGSAISQSVINGLSMSVTFSAPGVSRFAVGQWGSTFGHGITAYDTNSNIIQHFGPDRDPVQTGIYGYGGYTATSQIRFRGTTIENVGKTASYDPFVTASGDYGTGTLAIYYIGFEDNPNKGNPAWLPKNEFLTAPGVGHIFDYWLVQPFGTASFIVGNLSGSFQGQLTGTFTGTMAGFLTGSATGIMSGSPPGFTGSVTGANNQAGFITLSFSASVGDPSTFIVEELTGSYISGNLLPGDAYTYSTRSLQFYDISASFMTISITGSITDLRPLATPPPKTGQLWPRSTK